MAHLLQDFRYTTVTNRRASLTAEDFREQCSGRTDMVPLLEIFK
jgi:hypothetical protein